MSKKFLAIIATGATFILLSSVTYIRVRRYYAQKEVTRIYREGLKEIYDKNNPFCPGAALAFYDSLELLPTPDERKILVIELYKALSLLKLGQEKKAVELLQALASRTIPDGHDPLAIDIRKQLALAYLRLGERSNCISGHNSGSCLFPIRDNGVYTDPTASISGIQIYKQLLEYDSSDLESRWLLNIAYMTIGQYPSKVPAAWLIPGLDADSSADHVRAFADVARGLKINTFRNQAGGAIVDDFNNDGYLDIVTSSWSLNESMHFFKNNADGSFTDVSRESGLSGIKGGLMITQADYNNDGFTDILVARGAWMGEMGHQPKTLLRNNGDGTFTDVTVESGLLSFNPSQAAVWADFNNDGWLDLFIGNESVSMQSVHPSELWINNQDGTFTNVAASAGCDAIGFMKGVTAGDYDRDGWPDIFISCRDGQKILLHNKGQRSAIPQFENRTHEAGLDRMPTFTFPTWFWDYNNDGWPDIFVCGYQYQTSMAASVAADALGRPLRAGTGTMYLYRNNGNGTFTEVTAEAGLARPVFAMGSNFGDIDNDGWPDMYLGTGNPDFSSLTPNKLFRNVNGKRFDDVTTPARLGNLQKGHEVAFADVNNDGNQDIFVETGGAQPGDAYFNSLYINPGQDSSNSWISVQLEGVRSNRSAIGACIAASFHENGVKRTVYMDVSCGGSFGGNPLRKELGLGKATVIDELTIHWPTSGTVQVFKNVRPRQFVKIREGVDRLEPINLARLRFGAPADSLLIGCAPSP